MRVHQPSILLIADEPAAGALGALLEHVAAVPVVSASIIGEAAGPFTLIALAESVWARDPAAWAALVAAHRLPPVILLVATDAGAEERMHAVGAVDYLPLDTQDAALVARVLRTTRERHTAQAALAEARAAQAWATSVVAASADAIIRMDQGGRIVGWNRAAQQIYGWSAAAAVGQPITALLPPASGAELLRQIQRGRRIPQRDAVHLRRDGTPIDVMVTLVPVTAADGALEGAALLVHDMTAQRRSEAALRESEARLRTVLDHSRDAIYQLDLRTQTYDYGSASTLDVLGYTPAELRAGGPEFAFTLICPDDRERVQAHLARLVQDPDGPSEPAIEYRLRTRHRGWRWISSTQRVLRDADGTATTLVATLRDITESKQLLETTGQHLQRFRQIVETTHEGIFVLEAPATITYLNQRLADVLGYCSAELYGRSLLDLARPSDAPALAALLSAAAEQPPRTEMQLVHRDGTMRTCHITLSAMCDDDGTTCGIFGMVQDITERKQAEDARDRLAAVLEATPDCVAMATQSLELLSMNQAGRAMLGLAPDADLAELAAAMFIPPGLRTRMAQEVLPIAIRDGYWEGENTLLAADGREIPVSQVVIAHKDAQGAVQYFSTIARDMTDRVLAEVALRQSEARKAAILESSLDGVVSVDHAGRIVEFNAAAEQLFGHRRADVLGGAMTELLIPERWRAQHSAGMRQHLATGDGPMLGHRAELTALHADGHEFPIELTVTRLAPGLAEAPMYTSFIRDIRDRKSAEQALEDSQRRLQVALKAANVGLWDSDLVRGTTTYSAEWKRQIGYAEHEIGDGMDEWDSRVHPDDYPAAIAAVQRCIAGDSPAFHQEFRLRHKDGSYRWIFSQASVIRRPDGTAARMVGAHLDVTERKHAEQAVRDSEARLKQAQQIAQMGSYEHDLASDTIVWSDEVFRIMGYQPGAFDVTAQHVLELVHPADRAAMQQRFADAASLSGPVGVDHRIVRPDGEVRHLSVQAELKYAPDGRPQQIIGTIFDITERKLAQDAIERSEKLYHTLASNFPNGSVYLLDQNLRVLLAEGHGMRNFGIRREQTIGKLFGDYFPLPRFADLHALLLQALAGVAGNTEIQLGAEWRAVYAVPVRDEQGGVVQVMAMTQDVTAQRQAADALRKSEARLRRAQSVACLGSWEWEASTNTTECSDELFNIFGLTPGTGTLTRQTIGELVHPDDRPKAEAFFASLEQSGTAATEVRIRRPDGMARYISAQAENIYAAHGALERTLGTVLDVTESKLIEETLLYQANLLQNVSDAIVATDMAQRITTWNRAAELLYGWRADEVTGRSVSEILQSQLVDTTPAIARSALLEHGEWHGEAIQRHKDGAPLNVLSAVSMIHDPAGQRVGIVAVNRDLTEFKRVAEAVRANRERLEIALHSAQVGLWEWNAQTQETEFSLQWKQQLGYADDEIGELPDEWMQRLHPDEAPRVLDQLRQQLEGAGDLYRNEYRIRHKNGTYRWMLSQGTIFRDGAGTPLRVIGTQVDITELKLVEDELRQSQALLQHAHDQLEQRVHERTLELLAAKDEAERANAAKSEFLSRMSHELRTPLNSILGFAQIMEMDTLSPKQTDRVGYIMKAGKHLLHLINEVLDMAKVEAGRLRVAQEIISVHQTIKLAIDLVEPLVAQRGQQIVYDGATQPVGYVYADQQRLAQILLNLLSNATKYSYEGDAIRITVERRSTGRLRIVISDGGPGIPVEQQVRLFQPFERLHPAAGTVEGTGLGLALSKRLIELMGGTIDVESRLGAGSSFWIELPAVDPPAPASAPPAPSSAEPPRQVLLYIAEHLDQAEPIKQVLAGFPVALLTATSAQSGIELAARHRPAVMVLDLELPDMPGSDALERLRAGGAGDGAVVLLGPDASPHRIRRLSDLGASEYLTKPLDPRLLREIVLATLHSAEDSYAP